MVKENAMIDRIVKEYEKEMRENPLRFTWSDFLFGVGTCAIVVLAVAICILMLGGVI